MSFYPIADCGASFSPLFSSSETRRKFRVKKIYKYTWHTRFLLLLWQIAINADIYNSNFLSYCFHGLEVQVYHGSVGSFALGITG